MGLPDVTLRSRIFLLREIVQKCSIIGDELVAFCTQLNALDLVELMLTLMNNPSQGEGAWVAGGDYIFPNRWPNESRGKAALFQTLQRSGERGRQTLLDQHARGKVRLNANRCQSHGVAGHELEPG